MYLFKGNAYVGKSNPSKMGGLSCGAAGYRVTVPRELLRLCPSGKVNNEERRL